MSLNISPFTALTPTLAQAVTVTTGTYTFSASALPFPSARITNFGTVAAFIQFIDTGNTVTVGVTNSQPILATSMVVLACQKPLLAYVSPGTTTLYITAGTGGTAE